MASRSPKSSPWPRGRLPRQRIGGRYVAAPRSSGSDPLAISTPGRDRALS